MRIKRTKIPLLILLLIGNFSAAVIAQNFVGSTPGANSLKEAFAGKFYVGAALSDSQISGFRMHELELVSTQFNAVVAENCMKGERIQPEEGRFNFALPDKFVAFAEENDMWINGHTLVWHSQAPKWFFEDSVGRTVSREVLIRRMKDHIQTVVGRYKGRVHTWDVVNEAVLDNGALRKNKYYEIIGEDYLRLAFEFAHEADPDAELYYNDYSTTIPEKRAGILRMVKKLQQQGVPIDGIGMQGHVDLKHPSIAALEKSVLAFSSLGLKVMVTELDLSVLPSPWEMTGAEVSTNTAYSAKMDPFKAGLPDSVIRAFNRRYIDLFRLFLKHQDKIDRVTFWGVNDGNSWRNNWPIRGRSDYPLLFDRNNQPKTVLDSILRLSR